MYILYIFGWDLNIFVVGHQKHNPQGYGLRGSTTTPELVFTKIAVHAYTTSMELACTTIIVHAITTIKVQARTVIVGTK